MPGELVRSSVQFPVSYYLAAKYNGDIAGASPGVGLENPVQELQVEQWK